MTDLLKFIGAANVVTAGGRKLAPGDVLCCDAPVAPHHVQVTRDTIEELALRIDFERVGNVKPKRGKE